MTKTNPKKCKPFHIKYNKLTAGLYSAYVRIVPNFLLNSVLLFLTSV